MVIHFNLRRSSDRVAAVTSSAFAAALDRLLKDPAAARRMGSAARERALRVFSFDNYVDSYEALYRRLACTAGEARRVG